MNATAFGCMVYPWLRKPLKSLRNLLPARWHFPIPKLGTRLSADQIVSSFLNWVDRDQPTPFFAFLNFMDAHDYVAADPFRHRFALRSLRPVSRWTWEDAPPVPPTPADVRPKLDEYMVR